MTSKLNVLLLRESMPSSDSSQDKYESTFAVAKYTPFSTPALETRPTNITELASVTTQGDFDGVIMTSTHSCEAWDKANGRGKDESSRTAEQLANFILAERPRPPKLLYLTGDILPNILDGARVSLHSLKVYETKGSTIFPHRLKEIVPERPDEPWWIVFFAPSVADEDFSYWTDNCNILVRSPAKRSPEELLKVTVDVDTTS
ncbi:hypothetical protein DFS33DRAFT_1384488 [Desarmillaria ectypa]|nr:hypothetical protein DFS33DRAFT_1384488 [Desarmillaria ectypa]